MPRSRHTLFEKNHRQDDGEREVRQFGATTPELHRITAPTLVVGGGKDQVAGAAGSVIISRQIPNARLEILQDAGHGTYRLARDEYRSLLLEFLKDQGLTA